MQTAPLPDPGVRAAAGLVGVGLRTGTAQRAAACLRTGPAERTMRPPGAGARAGRQGQGGQLWMWRGCGQARSRGGAWRPPPPPRSPNPPGLPAACRGRDFQPNAGGAGPSDRDRPSGGPAGSGAGSRGYGFSGADHSGADNEDRWSRWGPGGLRPTKGGGGTCRPPAACATITAPPPPFSFSLPAVRPCALPPTQLYVLAPLLPFLPGPSAGAARPQPPSPAPRDAPSPQSDPSSNWHPAPSRCPKRVRASLQRIHAGADAHPPSPAFEALGDAICLHNRSRSRC